LKPLDRSMPMPLARFRVVDLTRVRAGPTAVRQLADWGASVVKVEALAEDTLGGARHGSDFQNLHRNKRSLTLDLKHPRGLAVLHDLVRRADVVVENYRPDVKHRLKIDYESLKAINPRLVYASISGFGQDGPYRARPGVDQIAQGMGGLMSITGAPGGGPMRVGIPIADLTAGLLCAQGILLALLEREVSGEGQWVQTSLLEAQIGMLDFQATRWLMDGEVPQQAGNDHPTMIPTGAFPTADGYFNLAAGGQDMFARLCAALERPELLEVPAYADDDARSRNRHALNAAIAEVTRTQPTAHWVEVMTEAGVPAGPILSIDQVFADPQVAHLGIAQTVEHPKLGSIRLVGQAVRLSRTPSALRTATPEKGADSDAILAELGYDAAAIASLRAERAI
jgi:formyl-CoA transferase